MFSVSKPNRAYGKRKSVTEKGTTLMSFHKVAPVKKTRKPGAKPAAAHQAAPKPKRQPRRRPVGNKAGKDC